MTGHLVCWRNPHSSEHWFKNMQTDLLTSKGETVGFVVEICYRFRSGKEERKKIFAQDYF